MIDGALRPTNMGIKPAFGKLAVMLRAIHQFQALAVIIHSRFRVCRFPTDSSNIQINNDL